MSVTEPSFLCIHALFIIRWMNYKSAIINWNGWSVTSALALLLNILSGVFPPGYRITRPTSDTIFEQSLLNMVFLRDPSMQILYFNRRQILIRKVVFWLTKRAEIKSNAHVQFYVALSDDGRGAKRVLFTSFKN